MLVLSWIVLIVSAFYMLINMLNVLISDNGKSRFLSSIDVVLFGLTAVVTFWNIFY